MNHNSGQDNGWEISAGAAWRVASVGGRGRNNSHYLMIQIGAPVTVTISSSGEAAVMIADWQTCAWVHVYRVGEEGRTETKTSAQLPQ